MDTVGGSLWQGKQDKEISMRMRRKRISHAHGGQLTEVNKVLQSCRKIQLKRIHPTSKWGSFFLNLEIEDFNKKVIFSFKYSG